MEVIVVGEDHYNTLGVVRSLGEKGLNCRLLIAGQQHMRSFVSSSKYVIQSVRTSTDSEDIWSGLLSLTEKLKNEEKAIIPTTDITAIFIDRCFDKFDSGFIVPSCKGKMMRLCDKTYMKKLAEEAGLLVPLHQVIVLDSTDEIGWEKFPAIVKPIRSIEGNKSDIKVVWSQEELIRCLGLLKRNNYSSAMIEEYIHSDNDYMVEYMGYVRKNGECVVSGALKKIREYPIQRGSTSYAEIYPNLPDVGVSQIQAFLSKTGFYGIFDIEFKSDGKNAYFIEVNFRNGAPSYALNAIGRNVAYEWISDAEPKNSEELIQNDKPVLLMHEFNDFKNCRQTKMGLGKWFRQYKNAQVKLVYNPHDIKPVFSYILKRTWDRLILKLKRKARQMRNKEG